MSAQSRLRQSCDRCHDQKLRCERTGDNDTGACNRCIRQSSYCVYSSSLPKGRPSQSRGRTATSSPTKRVAASPVSSEFLRPVSRITTATTDQTMGESTAAVESTIANDLSSFLASADSCSMILPQMPDPAPSSWPWLGSWGWSSALQEHGQGQLLSDPSQALDPLVVASTSRPNLEGNSVRLTEAGTAGHKSWEDINIDAFLYGQASSAGQSDTGGDTQTLPPKHTSPSAPSAAIAQLTQLSTRLYPLHFSSRALASAAGLPSTSSSSLPGRDSVVDNAVFESIMARILQNGRDKSPTSATARDWNEGAPLEQSTINHILGEAASASHQLLSVLSTLPRKRISTQSSPNSSSLVPEPASAKESSVTSSSSSSWDGSDSVNTVIHHLVMACHGMLLSIYIEILGVLQQEADEIWSASGLDAATGNVEASTKQEDSTVEEMDPLPDIRLVMIVQLCSYLIKRQQQVVDSYLSPRDYLARGNESSETPATSIMLQPNDLEVQVQLRLERLEETLCL